MYNGINTIGKCPHRRIFHRTFLSVLSYIYIYIFLRQVIISNKFIAALQLLSQMDVTKKATFAFLSSIYDAAKSYHMPYPAHLKNMTFGAKTSTDSDITALPSTTVSSNLMDFFSLQLLGKILR